MSADWARPVVHWEIVARDSERQAEFYRELFHWDIGTGPIRQIPACMPPRKLTGKLPRKAARTALP